MIMTKLISAPVWRKGMLNKFHLKIRDIAGLELAITCISTLAETCKTQTIYIPGLYSYTWKWGYIMEGIGIGKRIYSLYFLILSAIQNS